MKLIIGLGNPEPKYEFTRHNTGFLAVSDLFDHWPGFSPWKFNKKINAEISEGKINQETLILIKPQTYMNKSGEAVGRAARFYKLKATDVFVIHDDLDLPLGSLRLKPGGGAAGHRGVQSIIDAIGEDFSRVRLGIAPARRKTAAEIFVLKKFTAAEMKKLQLTIDRTVEAVSLAITEGLPKAMSLFNG